MRSTAATKSSTGESRSLWRPLRSTLFRNLLVAAATSDIGTFVQGVGATWLMISLNAGPLYVALTMTASALPFFVLALPAGAIGDILDRRKIILFMQVWMVAVSLVLTGLTVAGKMTPILLLIFTFALSAGDAFQSPTWRAVLPELVKKEDLPAASALNGIEFNLARAVGPALGGFLIAVAGVGAAFLINTMSFIGVIFVVARWKRPILKRATPPETLTGATVAAIRYVRYSPVVRIVLLRSGMTLFFASGLLALLPSVARGINNSPAGYGVLLGCFGCGAILGALAMHRVQRSWPADLVVAVGIADFGLATIVIASQHQLWPLAVFMLVGGAAWISFISLFNVQVLTQTPDWVRARVLAISMLVIQGAIAAGSTTWGFAAAHVGVSTALVWAGIGTILTTILGVIFRLPDVTVDLSPWNHWRLPRVFDRNIDPKGPVLVTVEYQVHADRRSEFINTMHDVGRVRRRDGATRWGICRDVETTDRYLEAFIVNSWAEHVRQHDRLTRVELEVEARLRNCILDEPNVRHLLYV